MENKKVIYKGYLLIFIFLSVVFGTQYFNLLKFKDSKNFYERVIDNFSKTKYFGIKVIKTPSNNSKRLYASKFFDDSKNSMDSFFNQLQKLEQQKLSTNVKIMFYGTSSIGFDRVTSKMRANLQPVFGNGGKGFITATRGWRYQRHKDIKWAFSDNWKVMSLTDHIRDKHEHGLYGLGGVLSTNTNEAWIKLSPEKRFSIFTMYYQKGINSGSINIEIDNEKQTIETRDKTIHDEIFNIPVKDDIHSVVVKTGKQPVNIYGFSFNRNTGLLIDALMLVGAYIHQMNYFDKEHISSMIAARKPDLIIFNMGAKDAYYSPDDKKIEDISTAYITAINNYKSKIPNVSCLIISIKDLGQKAGNNIITRLGVEKMVSENKKVALQTGCAFFNMFEAMGGKGSMAQWRQQGLVSKDLGHLFNSGAKKIGDIISNMILEEYKNYKLLK